MTEAFHWRRAGAPCWVPGAGRRVPLGRGAARAGCTAGVGLNSIESLFFEMGSKEI